MPERLVKKKEAAEILRCSVATIDRWCCYGGGPKFVKIGRAVRFRLEDIESFIRERVVEKVACQDNLADGMAT